MRALALLVLGVLVAGCTHPDQPDEPVHVLAGGGGGTITDTPATFPTFTASPTTVLNDGTGSATFTIVVNDVNTETDIKTITLFVNATGTTLTHTVSATERVATTEPASFGSDGWKVWTGTLADGILNAKYLLAIPSGTPAATYTFGVRDTNVNDVASYPPSSTQIPLVVRAPTLVTVASAPVNATGVAQTGLTWGQWTASPGDANAPAMNYLKLTNSGGYPNPQVVIDFTQASFAGANDSSYVVPIDGNVQFAWWEDATGTAKPNAGTYTWGPTSNDGSVTVSFTGTGRVIYVTYRIVSMPSVLRAQSYSATFTATDI